MNETMNLKYDITNERDVKDFVDLFYQKVNQDDLLSPIFNDISHVNWELHLPKMYKFWETLIFGSAAYKGNPFEAHIPLPIDENHFDRWISTFEETIDDLFEGPVAEHTKLRAKSIAHVFQSKLKYIHS